MDNLDRLVHQDHLGPRAPSGLPDLKDHRGSLAIKDHRDRRVFPALEGKLA